MRAHLLVDVGDREDRSIDADLDVLRRAGCTVSTTRSSNADLPEKSRSRCNEKDDDDDDDDDDVCDRRR